MNRRSRWSGICTGDQAIFVERKLFETLGGYGDLPLMEDIDFSRRARRIAWPVALRPAAITSGRRWEQRGVGRTDAADVDAAVALLPRRRPGRPGA